MLPPAAASLDEADAAIELWEHYKKRRLDASQRLVVYVLMALRADGLWAAATTGRGMPRQNGKGDEIEVVELWDLVQRAARVLHTIHDAVLLATETQARMLSVLEGHGDLRRKILRVWRGTGQQMIELRNGGTIWYRTRTGGGARGVDEVDRVVVDEAQHAEEDHISAISPTLLASANPQLNAMGSAGIAGKSAWWWDLRKRALRDDGGSFGYVEHTAEDVSIDGDGKVQRAVVDVHDRELWHRSNPVLTRRPEIETFLEDQLGRLTEEKFAREHLNVWDAEPAGEGEAAVSLNVWAALVDPGSAIESRPCLALDISPDRQWASFGAAGRRVDGLVHVEVVDRRPGTGWVLGRAKELVAKYGPLRVEKRTSAASWITKLTEAGVELVSVSKDEHAQAAGQFLDAVDDSSLRHLGQGSMVEALKGAVLQASGDAEVWGRRKSHADVSALVAVTLALGGVPAPVATAVGFYGDDEGDW